MPDPTATPKKQKTEQAPRGTHALAMVRQYIEMKIEILTEVAGPSETTAARIDELKAVLRKMEGK